MASSKAGKTLGSTGVDIGPDVGEELEEAKLEVSFEEEEEDIKPSFSVARYKTHYHIHNPLLSNHMNFTSNHSHHLSPCNDR